LGFALRDFPLAATMAALAAHAEEPVLLIAKFRGEEIELPVTTATQIIQIKVCVDPSA
jgi:hypothetical protein